MKGKTTRLRVLRADHEPHITQHKLARKARINVTRYWQIENGEGLPPTETERAAIAEALGVKVTAIAWPDLEQAAAS